MIIVENILERAKKKVKPIKGGVEDYVLYPLLNGSSIKNPFEVKIDKAIVLPHDKKNTTSPLKEKTMQSNFPKAYAYLKQFESKLKKRPSYISRRSQYPFYCLFRINDEIFYPYKVVWARQTNKIKAAVVGSVTNTFFNNKPVIPTDTVTYVGTKKKDEAHFICAVLNSSLVSSTITSYSSAGRGFAGTHVLENIRIPEFDSSNKIHVRLTKLSVIAHKLKNKSKEMKKTQKSINELVGKMDWSEVQKFAASQKKIGEF